MQTWEVFCSSLQQRFPPFSCCSSLETVPPALVFSMLGQMDVLLPGGLRAPVSGHNLDPSAAHPAYTSCYL